MYRISRTVLALCFALVATTAMALDLQQAKDRGLVGEQRNGYLGVVVSNPPADVNALVAQVNDGRKAEYRRIADANNLDIGQVERLAAEKAIGKTRPGLFVQGPDGGWVRK